MDNPPVLAMAISRSPLPGHHERSGSPGLLLGALEAAPAKVCVLTRSRSGRDCGVSSEPENSLGAPPASLLSPA